MVSAPMVVKNGLTTCRSCVSKNFVLNETFVGSYLVQEFSAFLGNFIIPFWGPRVTKIYILGPSRCERLVSRRLIIISRGSSTALELSSLRDTLSLLLLFST